MQVVNLQFYFNLKSNMGKKDNEFGSQADLIKNEAGMAQEDKKASKFSRNSSVRSKVGEFDNVSQLNYF